MNIKTLAGLLCLIGLSFFLYAVNAGSSYHALLPLFMLAFPVLVGHRVKINFSLQDFSLGLVVSAAILIPYYFLFGGTDARITVPMCLYQMLAVSFPEEFFFRGFLQDSIGRSFKAIVLTSLFFSLSHLPKAIFAGEWAIVLSFFPSLIMGWLYMKTNNILPGVIFHFLANLVY